MEESDFVQKYGAIDVVYIDPPQKSVLFSRPFALNYFHEGRLYRTRNERSSAKMELFLDLLYVGLLSSIAEPLIEVADGKALLKYFILYFPIFTVWFDITSFMNYYFNDDLTQRLYILWITILLMIYANSTGFVLDGHKYTAMCVVPYMLCRLSVAISGLIYAQFVIQHRTQLRIYSALIFVITPIWIAVIFVGVRAKIGISIALMIVEQFCYSVCTHPRFKKLVKVTHGTALNIEHFVERFASFYIIAIGEFLYTVVSGHPLGAGITTRLWKGVLVLMIAYIFMWLYFNGDCGGKLVHALRRSGFTAIMWIYLHIPLIGTLIITADAASELIKLDEVDLSRDYEGELSLYGLSFFFTGGVLIALVCVSLLALCDRPLEHGGVRAQFYRVFPRFPIAVITICLSLAEMKPVRLIGLTTMLLSLLFIYEIVFVIRPTRACKEDNVSDDNDDDDNSSKGNYPLGSDNAITDETQAPVRGQTKGSDLS